jgi:hypothetical protein
MKKFYSALLALLLITSIPALAQKGFYIGIAGTAQSTWIINQENYGLKPLNEVSTLGGSGNINVGYDFTNHIGIKVEFGYGTFGQKYSKTIGDSAFSRNIKLNYFMIPVLFKYRVGGPVVKFYFAIGPQFNMLMSANQTYTLNGETFDTTLKTISGKPFEVGLAGIKDRFASMDIFARMDLGLDITLVKHLMIEFGLKLGYGLMDINATDYQLKDKDGNYNKSHNVFGGLTLGINYRL